MNDSNQFNVNLNNFNGPLEVLLDLAKSQKVNLENISITKLVDQFIEFMRKAKNLIISDDISMKALTYSISENTKKAFKAGCNLVLHCNGKINEMSKVAENSPPVSEFIKKKTSQFNKIIR